MRTLKGQIMNWGQQKCRQSDLYVGDSLGAIHMFFSKSMRAQVEKKKKKKLKVMGFISSVNNLKWFGLLMSGPQEW